MESLLRLDKYDINIQYTESYRNGVLSILTFPFSVHLPDVCIVNQRTSCFN